MILKRAAKWLCWVAIFAASACGRTGAPGFDDEVAAETACANGLDDDLDGATDCDDPDCGADPGCAARKELCDNGVDDDGDGLVDCDDPDCGADPGCAARKEQCANGVDDDGDELVDCDDPDCGQWPGCAGERCGNELDDDDDGLVDCEDPDCFTDPRCSARGEEICNNGLDDDFDGFVDCADDECAWRPICQAGAEVCDNGVDDDGDGAVDCADPDCLEDPACRDLLCHPSVDFGPIAAHGAEVTRTVVTSGRQEAYVTPCVVPGGGEVVARFELPEPADVLLGYEQLAGDHAVGLFRAGVDQPCNANPIECLDPEGAQSGSFPLRGLAAGSYYLIVEAFAAGLEGELQLTLSTGTSSGEICQNGVDDDGDGAVDCADLDCALDPICESLQCQWDVNIGALVINGPVKEVQLDTASATDDLDETCAGGGGGDRVVRLVMPESGGILVQVHQHQGWHVFGLRADQGPGTTCTADADGSCFDSNDALGFGLVYQGIEKGVYYYNVDALTADHEGNVTISFSAFANRGPELCQNEVDDDGDGLVDCLDPDCAGTIGCPGPVCQPELATGPLAPGGPPVNFQVDTQTANNDQTVTCALGGGKDVVIAVELTEVSGLQVGCQQTGDHVLGLFTAARPRDPCDEQPINCADPQVGSLGCDFIFPNLQPGRYYVVVEAFKPGAEGTMTLALSATPDHAQEICNNNVDDDGDGLVDCQDANCASKPICQGQGCTPDRQAGLIVKGAPPLDVAVTTKGAGDAHNTSCAAAGGEDVVVALTLAEQATIDVAYAQFGNHALALFEDRGVGFACDAAPLACQATGGQSIGEVTFGDVPAGDYLLIVEAAGSASAGSVLMQIGAR